MRDPSFSFHEISIATSCSILSGDNSVFDKKQILFKLIMDFGKIKVYSISLFKVEHGLK